MSRLSHMWPPDDERWNNAGHLALQVGDEIVAANGMPFPRYEQTSEILSHHLEAAFAVQAGVTPLSRSVRRIVVVDNDIDIDDSDDVDGEA